MRQLQVLVDYIRQEAWTDSGRAWLFSALIAAGGFPPETLAITSLDLISVRLSPGVLSAAIGLAAGAAAAFGLTTSGPTSLIGVMIAAAPIPAVATSGIAIVCSEPRVAVGSFLLLVVGLVGRNRTECDERYYVERDEHHSQRHEYYCTERVDNNHSDRVDAVRSPRSCIADVSTRDRPLVDPVYRQ